MVRVEDVFWTIRDITAGMAVGLVTIAVPAFVLEELGMYHGVAMLITVAFALWVSGRVGYEKGWGDAMEHVEEEGMP